jgi:hypothetical protein
MVSWEPTGSLTMRHDVGDRLAMHGEHDALASPDRVDDLACLIPEFADTDLHVR